MAKDKTKSTRGKEQSAPAAGAQGKIAELVEFFKESQVEIKKVVWPSRKETITTCAAVLVVTVVIALYLGVVDLGLTKLIEFILS